MRFQARERGLSKSRRHYLVLHFLSMGWVGRQAGQRWQQRY